jgi:transposase
MRVFETLIEQVLIKELKLSQVVIMDNASFHKSQRTIEFIESVGCRVIFLPPYSPDLNPIEKFWANMKGWIKYQMTQFNTLYDILVQFFKPKTST